MKTFGASRWIRLIGFITLVLWTYVVVKCIALREPSTTFDTWALFAALGFGLLHTSWYWTEWKRRRNQHQSDNTEPDADS